MTSLKALGGTSDILPEEAKRWHVLEEQARTALHRYGYQEIRTPLIEESAVFTASLGEAAEIVTKQMYLFNDRGGRQVALRPEGTAPVVRAFIEHGLDKTAGLTRLYYLGPMFRAERPQAGRRRQFHQLGVEVFGSSSPYQDAEVLLLLSRLLREWGLSGYVLKLNSLGCRADRGPMVEQVRRYLLPSESKLCADCQVRLKKNPLRILDCKEPGCQALSAGADIAGGICSECRRHFEQLTDALRGLQVPFERDPHLVRGLDYYTRTAFEVIHDALGAQNALGGGGRYDDLVEQLGGSPSPAIGFAIGLERVLMVLESRPQGAVGPRMSPEVFVATVTAAQIPEALRLVEFLRDEKISASVNLEDRPLKRQLEQASKLVPEGYVLILGEEEISKGVVTVRQMNTGKQEQVPRSALLQRCLKRLAD